jgi:hypothetical protein
MIVLARQQREVAVFSISGFQESSSSPGEAKGDREAPPNAASSCCAKGHVDLVRNLADLGAANPNYVTYFSRETLITVALDREYDAIAEILRERHRTGDPCRPDDEGGEILSPWTMCSGGFRSC